MKKDKPKKPPESVCRIVEKSISKITWDLGGDELKITSGKLDYQTHWIMDAIANKIARNPQIPKALGLENADDLNDPERLLTVLTCSEIKSFLKNQNIGNRKIRELALRLPDLIFFGKVKIPIAIEGRWLILDFYKDNFCGVALANEHKEFYEHRSDRKLRSKGAGIEEPVFVFIFTNPYGKTFFRNAMRWNGRQLQNPKLYKLSPNAQNIFQAVRWKKDQKNNEIILGIERMSRIMNLKWPPIRMNERVVRIRRALKELHENGFIIKPIESGEFSKDKVWMFQVDKKYLLSEKKSY